MINDILTGLPWGIFLSFMIGPVFFILIETSITKGFRAALAFDLGVVLGDVFFIGVAYLGSYRLISSLKDKPVLFIFGGIVMVAYGIISFVKLKKQAKIQYEAIEDEIIKKGITAAKISSLESRKMIPKMKWTKDDELEQLLGNIKSTMKNEFDNLSMEASSND